MSAVLEPDSSIEIRNLDQREDAKTPEHHDKGHTDESPDEAQGDNDESQYPSMKIVIPTILALYLAVFLTALDRTIIGVAIPAISNEFKSFNQIAWYESAFLLGFVLFGLPMGKIFTYFPVKWTFLSVVAIFEIGSIVCASAPSSVAFIVGRAITGVGGAGSFTGAQIIITELVPLRKRAKYGGLIGAVFGLASIIGPLVGGVFTTHVTWRWCFWLNVPIGGAALVSLFLILPVSQPAVRLEGTLAQKILKFDPFGNALLAPGLICVLIALQYGGTIWPWSDGRVIALLVVGVVLLLGFAIVQLIMKDNGTIPPRILRQRSIAAAAVVSIGIGATLIITTFYLPIYFQAIKGMSAAAAGVRILAYFLGTVVFVVASGVLISKSGYYTPWLIIGCAVLIVGIGLLTTLSINTSTGKWVGYQLIVGAGIGATLQQCSNAAFTVLSKKDVPTGIAVLGFTNFFGGTIFISICQTVLANTLRSDLAASLPDFDTAAIANTGATSIRNLVPEAQLLTVLVAYNHGLQNVFYTALACACLALVGSLFFEWRSMRSKGDMKTKMREDLPITEV